MNFNVKFEENKHHFPVGFGQVQTDLGYKKGYAEGEAAGYNSGYEIGAKEGAEVGYSKGYAEGKKAAKEDRREITEGALTAEEANAISAYVPGAYFTVSLFAKTVYNSAYIDLDPVFGKLGFFDILKKNFDVDTGLLLDEAEREATFAKMLMPGYYGGKRYTANGAAYANKTFNPTDFNIGDLFMAAQDEACSVTGNRWVYFFGIYQGAGKFLVVENHSSAACTDCQRIYIDSYGVPNNSVVWGNTAQMNKHRYYFVLRPENLATA